MRPIIIAAALGAAACVPVAPAGPALPLVSATVEQGAAVGVTGEARFDVVATRDGASVPAACTAEGAGFRAAFTAPATLAVPSYGAASQPVRVACTADGRQGARVLVPAERATGVLGGVYPAIGIGIGTGGGDGWAGSGAGVSIGGVWNPGASGAAAAVRYPDIAIPIE